MINSILQNISNNFWTEAGGRGKYPCDIERAVLMTTPLNIISLNELSFKKIDEWFLKKRINVEFNYEDRFLHGFITIKDNFGFIFINGSDSIEERRATIAHEVAHYLLEYKLLRERAATTFGPAILEVLDGYREPSIQEKVEFILSAITIRPFTHILEKEGNGTFLSRDNWIAENDADNLAFELLASFHDIKNDIHAHPSWPLNYNNCKEVVMQLLIYKYALPFSFIETYSGNIAAALTGGRSVKEILGLS